MSKKTRNKAVTIIIVLIVILITISCKKENTLDKSYEPVIDPMHFIDVIDNVYLPLAIGTTYIYEGNTEDGFEHIEVSVTDEKKIILGVQCTVVRDQVWVNGELEEDTDDWYAQDSDGNVWYFGEDSKTISNGKIIDREGSWEAGIDGAQPGIIMKSKLTLGEAYRQEYYYSEAEDMAEIIDFSQSISINFGTYDNVLRIKEWTPLEPDVVEYKYYAQGIGLILEEIVEGGSGKIELIDIVNNLD